MVRGNGGLDKVVRDGLVSGWTQLELRGSAGRQKGWAEGRGFGRSIWANVMARSLLPLECKLHEGGPESGLFPMDPQCWSRPQIATE